MQERTNGESGRARDSEGGRQPASSLLVGRAVAVICPQLACRVPQTDPITHGGGFRYCDPTHRPRPDAALMNCRDTGTATVSTADQWQRTSGPVGTTYSMLIIFGKCRNIISTKHYWFAFPWNSSFRFYRPNIRILLSVKTYA